ncbi:MAG: family 10 glycosylhydrolase [Muribaculaceae bacterium]|nr:family 10 glycosylhydrolase [Muribaculaceae bacterium]
MKTTKVLLCLALLLPSIGLQAQTNPKREFRGAWMHTVFQGQYHRQTSDENKAYLIGQLDSLKEVGVNAVLFQVRPQADAFYESKFEPWSCYLTDNGEAPVPYWDPLKFMIDECHARGMELHAWLNPYRVTSNTKQIGELPKSHIYHQHPERFLKYDDGKLYFDPGLPENREFICKVVEDIITRYDVDGIHFDDYFYPYPVKDKDFPDDASYAKYGNGMDRGDWRRQNVDRLIEDIHNTIAATRPWVRFGISPFGIWRNKKSDPRGSDTNGLQNYDALYADVLLWDEKGWIDYLLPQLYWTLEHKSASSLVLVDWWANVGLKRHLYIGQDIGATMKNPDLPPSTEKTQLRHKIELTRQNDNIHGNCWWPGYSLSRNVGGVADSLKTKYQSTPALVPTYPWIKTGAPAPVAKVRLAADNSFSWDAPIPMGKAGDVVKFAVYRFDNRKNIDIEAPGALVALTYSKTFKPTKPGVYVVTALDRVNNESEPSKPIVIK